MVVKSGALDPRAEGTGPAAEPIRRSIPRSVIAFGVVSSLAGGAFAVAQSRDDEPASVRVGCADPYAQVTWVAYLACQSVIIQGQVVKVEPGAGRGRQRVTLDVAEWLKPADGPKRTALDVRPLIDSDNAGSPLLKRGSHYLLVVPKCHGSDTTAYTSSRFQEIRGRVIAALPDSAAFEHSTDPC